jgi:asparagine synthase (glutamine-hydrolysing)
LPHGKSKIDLSENKKRSSLMSFFVLFNSDRAAVDLDRLERTNPQILAQNVQVLGRDRQVVFTESQPGSSTPSGDATCRHTFDGRFWIIGRIRLDAREQTCAIISGWQTACEGQSDALIFLRAYGRWGDRCLDFLRGDFCFVLWDEDRQRLFCGRDQLGVRPLFYARQRHGWIVSDSLATIVAQATVSSDVDHFWVADFLSSGTCADLDRTVYKQVKRLPAAHFLSVCARGCAVQKYWKFENREPIYYPRRENYIEHFHEVVGVAVKDRLPQDRVGISMSGGLDSSTLAAHVLRATRDPSKIIAHTRHFEHLMADEERHFSSLVASRLGIPLTLRAIDDACYDAKWQDRETMPEPNSAIISAFHRRVIAAEMAEQSKVWFYAEGPDNALVFEWQPYLRWLLKKMEWSRLGGAVVQYFVSKQVKEWRLTVSNYIKNRPPAERRPPFDLPQWLNEGFVTEHQLIARAGQLRESSKKKHPWHPSAIASFTGPVWQYFLEQFDPSISGTRLAWRHPYLDLRVLTFLLSVPPIPWARRKRLIREAMREFLPKEVLARDKAPLSGDPLARMVQKYGPPQLSPDGPIHYYIDRTKVPKILHDEMLIRPLIRVHVLDAWLKSNARGLSRGKLQ